MKLKYIYRGDFRKNEVTLLEEARKEAGSLRLTRDDCLLVVSYSRKLLRFIFGFEELSSGKKTVEVLPSKTHRIIRGGAWNPLMLQDYAEAVGIQLDHLKKFKDHYKRITAEKRRRG